MLDQVGLDALPDAVNATSESKPSVPPKPKKLAVVVIHGMGEQQPMQTLRGFVEAVWQSDPELFAGLDKPEDHELWDTWTKPDKLSGSSELRRITTARARNPGEDGAKGKRADFFELHWADLTADSTWGDFGTWFKGLLLRRPWRCEVPPRVRLPWALLWLLVVLIVLSGISAALPNIVKAIGFDPLKGTWVGWLLDSRWLTAFALASLAVGGVVKGFLTLYFGDVARYVTAAPRNIRVRHEARERGLKLLRELTRSDHYDRIVVVGHSLGSVLAHDLVSLFWFESTGSLRAAAGSPLHQAILDCQLAGEALLKSAGWRPSNANELRRDDDPCDCQVDRPLWSEDARAKLAGYRLAQRVLYQQLAALRLTGPDASSRPAWLISDLVTVGSPLTHAEFLLARGLCELRVMMNGRELLRCPPVFEMDAKQRFGLMHEVEGMPGHWAMHHAAAMAPTRWTNVHDASGPWAFLSGDLISGPVARDFGPAAVDVRVRVERPGGLFPRLFTHTDYWTQSASARRGAEAAPDHVRALRDAINLLDDAEVEARLLRRAAT
jgi:hypothetical protein